MARYRGTVGLGRSNHQNTQTAQSWRLPGTLAATVAVVCLASFQTLFADQNDAKTQDSTRASARDGSDSGAIPELILKLNLTAKQHDQIQQIARDYDQSINTVWNQFRDRYMQTIRLETSMLSAIEDQLTDTQREKIRTHRRSTANHEKVSVNVQEKSDVGDRPKVTVKTDPSKDKPTGEVDIDAPHVGVALTRDQEAQADKVHQKYRPHLRSMNREIHRLHNRLLSLETEKMAEIEQVLTKDQLIQLRALRQNAPDSTKITLRLPGEKQ